ncbi:MAG: hypothetical protein P5687_19275 [Limnospira sp. PMC 1042.18]|nr:hypothetical protein [Limnospira sp. PMC 1042.18]MDT9200219.1 hypothetical protein [Limnospira sp. PMC 1042.18]
MKPKISTEAEDLQDGRTRRGIKAEKIGSTARGFVDLDEDGSPKGVGGTIDSINDANVSVYFGECEQTMSVTMFGKTVTFARNVCEDDIEEPSETDENETSDDQDNNNPPSIDPPSFPPGYSGPLADFFLATRHTYISGWYGTLYSGMLDRLNNSDDGITTGEYIVSSLEFQFNTIVNSSIQYIGTFPSGPGARHFRDLHIQVNGTPPFITNVFRLKSNFNLGKGGAPVHLLASIQCSSVQSLRLSRGSIRPSVNRICPAHFPIGRDPETNILMAIHSYYWYTQWEVILLPSSSSANNYQPEPPPSLPILPDDMNKDCCDDLIKMTREIHKALGVRKLLDKSFQVPANMMMPEGRGNHQNKDYLEIMSDLFKTIDNYGFDAPVTVTVQDTNKAQEGDQSIELKFNSLGAILKAQTELLIELKGDSANRLNIQIRLAYIMTRMYRTLAKLYYRTSAILDGLGIPIISKVVTLPIEFNVFGKKHWGAGKGFGKDNKKGQEPKLDLNDEDTTEAMLPDLLEIHDYEIEVDEFRAKSNDLYEVLIGIAAKLRS